MPNKTTVITGASGNRRRVARRLGAEGHQLVLASRRPLELDAVALDAERAGSPRAVAMQIDVRDRDKVDALSLARREFGVLTCGSTTRVAASRVPFCELTGDDFDEMMSVNVKSALYGMQAAAPLSRARGGHIVNVSSFLGQFRSRFIARHTTRRGGPQRADREHARRTACALAEYSRDTRDAWNGRHKFARNALHAPADAPVYSSARPDDGAGRRHRRERLEDPVARCTPIRRRRRWQASTSPMSARSSRTAETHGPPEAVVDESASTSSSLRRRIERQLALAIGQPAARSAARASDGRNARRDGRTGISRDRNGRRARSIRCRRHRLRRSDGVQVRNHQSSAVEHRRAGEPTRTWRSGFRRREHRREVASGARRADRR